MLVVHARRAARRSGGFTFVELVVTITVAAVLASLALPAFQSFIANQRVRNAAFDLMAALMFTRNQAVTRSGDVSFIKTGSGEWNGGWTVKAGDTTLLTQAELSGLSITASESLGTVTYGKDGRVSASTTCKDDSVCTKFTVGPATTNSAVASRCITIAPSGLPSSRSGACS